MAQPGAPPHPDRAGSAHLFRRVPLAPVWTGLLIAVAWFGFYLAFAVAAGWLEGGPPGVTPFSVDLAFEIFWAVLIGYLPTATAYSLRGATRALERLRPALDCPDAAFAERLRELTRFDRGARVAVAILGILLGLGLPYAPGFWVDGRPPIGDPFLTWVWVRGSVFSWLVLRTLHLEIVTARRFSEVGSRWARVDLLDLAPLAPFARRGLASVLLLVGLTVIFSIQFAAPWKTAYLTIASQIGFLGVAVAAMLLPMLGVHRRIHAVKRESLARLSAEIRERGDPTLRPRADPRLAELIAYRGLVESVHTWPFDVPTLLRFGLYVGVGLGSWLGAAFVERLLDLVLG